MTHYDYHKFIHPVPKGYTIPKDTQVQLVNTSTDPREVLFFTTLDDFEVEDWEDLTYYLDYDITRPKLPMAVTSVIYNVRVGMNEFPVAVNQGSHLWSAFNNAGERRSIFSTEIESFDTTPSKEDEEQ